MSQTIQQIFKEKFIRIREFLQTQSNERTDEGLIDMRNVLESFPFFIQFTKQNFHQYTSTKSQDFISMCRHLQLEEFDMSQTLFRQGDSADKFYMVLKGAVSIFINIPGSEEQKQVGELGIGGAFGELALLFNSERNATIKVDAGTELIVLHKDDFKKYMKFQSSEYANQAFQLINSMDEFKGLDFPDRVRLASKMDFKSLPSNHTIISQGQQFAHMYIVQSGLIKFYRDVEFNVNNKGSISFTSERLQHRGCRTLKIEIDEVGPGRYFGEYEIYAKKASQFTALTHMPCSVFCISLYDFNLMSQFQLSAVCKNSKPYPSDDDIRAVFLDGVQWRVFRKQLVGNLKQKQPQVRDPKSVAHEKYHRDLKMFAVNTLSYERLMSNYISENQNHVMTSFRPPEEDNSMSPQAKRKNISGLFNNVDNAIKVIKKEYQNQTLPVIPQKRGPNQSKSVLPKINIKVGSSIYNILKGG